MQSYFGPDVDYDKIREKRIELMDDFVAREGVTVKPGIQQLLDYLKKQGIKTAIATSSPMERTLLYLSSVGLQDSFDELVSGYMVEKGKPEPDIFLYAAKKLGVEPKRCIVLEDSPAGILAAHRAGCKPVMIPDQDEPDRETTSLLFAKVSRADEVMNLLG